MYNRSVDNEAIGRRIKNARERAGLTQDELGKRIGYQQGTISAYERGQIDGIRLDTLEAIAHATGSPIQEFLAEVPVQPATLAEVLRRDYPDMDAGTIETLSEMAAFLYEKHRRAAARKRRTGRTGGRVTPGTSGSTATPEEASPLS